MRVYTARARCCSRKDLPCWWYCLLEGLWAVPTVFGFTCFRSISPKRAPAVTVWARYVKTVTLTTNWQRYSALEVFNGMRYINLCFTHSLTYLLTYNVIKLALLERHAVTLSLSSVLCRCNVDASLVPVYQLYNYVCLGRRRDDKKTNYMYKRHSEKSLEMFSYAWYHDTWNFLEFPLF